MRHRSLQRTLITLLASTSFISMASCQRGQSPALSAAPTGAPGNIVRRQSAEEASRPGQVVIRFKLPKTQVAIENYAKANQLKVLRVLSEGKVVLFQHFKAGVSTQNVIRSFSASTSVESSQPNYVYTAAQMSPRNYAPQPTTYRRFNEATAPATGNAPATSQYALAALGLPQAWQTTQGNPNIKIAVIDSGVDPTHPDLIANLLPGAAFIGSKDTNTQRPAWTDEFGHGTHVAGIIAAMANNVGVTGVAPFCKILPVKVLDEWGNGDTVSVSQGVEWATAQGAQVMNLSLRVHQRDPVMEEAINKALANNTVVVAATGNDGGVWEAYPAAFDGVIGVGSIDEQRVRANTSNYGDWISVVAPGVNILSTKPTYPLHDNPTPGAPYEMDSGTSMAAPAVAGIAALLLSKNPQLTAKEVKWRIEQSATDLGEPGFDQYYGHGMVNASAALNTGEMVAFR
jgi:thermitase